MMTATILALGTVSCSSDDDAVSVSEEQVVGLWEEDPDSYYIEYNGKKEKVPASEVDGAGGRAEFRADHTYSVYDVDYRTGKYVEDTYDRGTWSLSGNELTIKFDHDGDVSKATIKAISSSAMTLRITDEEEDDDGRTISYYVYTTMKRVK